MEQKEAEISPDVRAPLTQSIHALSAAYYARYDALLDIVNADRLDVALNRIRFYRSHMASNEMPSDQDIGARQDKAVERIVRTQIDVFAQTSFVTTFHEGAYRDALNKVHYSARVGMEGFCRNNNVSFDRFETAYQQAQAEAARHLAEAIKQEMELRASSMLSLKKITAIDPSKLVRVLNGEAARMRHFRVNGQKIEPDADLAERQIDRLLTISEPKLRTDYFKLMRLSGASAADTKPFMALYHKAAARQGPTRLKLLEKFTAYYTTGAAKGQTPNPMISRALLVQTLAELYVPHIALKGKADMPEAQASAFNACLGALDQIIAQNPDQVFPFNNPKPPRRAHGTLAAPQGFWKRVQKRLSF